MSQANAAARKRRGVPSSTPTPAMLQQNSFNYQQNQPMNMQPPQAPQSSSSGIPPLMSIQQIIQYLDSRLVTLEQNSSDKPESSNDSSLQVKLAIEYNDRFNMIAKELADLQKLLEEKENKITHLESSLSMLQTMHFQLDEKVNNLPSTN
jgi:hypothetical protein